MANLPATTGMQSKMVGPSLTKEEERRQRKKLQNRLNQRARRLRMQMENSGQNPLSKQPFQVRRWRVSFNDSYPSYAGAQGSHNTHATSTEKKPRISGPESDSDSDSDSGFDSVLPSEKEISSRAQQIYNTRIPPSANKLLHLIQYNTFRGLFQNKIILGRTSLSYEPGRDPLRFDEAFPTHSMVYPISSNVPEKLKPTQSQMSLIHATWINTLPFPAMRENFIKWETSFNHAEFGMDVLGHIMDPILFPPPAGLPTTRPPAKGRVIAPDDDIDDNVTAGRNGLILWGEPYRAESWEATPGFLRKWAWAMQGCDELIESSNRWRKLRGEQPIQFSIQISTEEEP